jgi:hypothetical protein
VNCQSCQNAFEDHRRGTLTDDIRTQFKSHLQGCTICTEEYKLLTLAERVIDEEKKLQSNPFLSTRIMARIEAIKSPGLRRTPVFTELAKPFILVIILAIVIAAGVAIGSMYRYVPERNSIPAEMALIDDAAIESVSVLSNDQN